MAATRWRLCKIEAHKNVKYQNCNIERHRDHNDYLNLLHHRFTIRSLMASELFSARSVMSFGSMIAGARAKLVSRSLVEIATVIFLSSSTMANSGFHSSASASDDGCRVELVLLVLLLDLLDGPAVVSFPFHLLEGCFEELGQTPSLYWLVPKSGQRLGEELGGRGELLWQGS